MTFPTSFLLALHFDQFSGMCFNGIFFVCGMLNMEIWDCFKYADIGFSVGLTFCFGTAAIDLSIKASQEGSAAGKVIIEKSRGEVSPMGQDTIENVS